MMGKKIHSPGLYFLVFVGLLVSLPSHGARFFLNEDSNIVGEIKILDANPDETLVSIARLHDIGFDEMRAANPNVDMWVPKEGQKVVVPSMFILPEHPQEGLVINLAEMRLYYFPKEKVENRKVVYTFPIGIGREGWATPLGKAKITQKKKDPSWTPPESIRQEHEEMGDPLPKVVPPGPDNPLGLYALRLSIPGYLIHGTNKPDGVGMRVSHGCIRMYPEDISSLHDLVNVGLPVNIVDQPIKIGWQEHKIKMEVHLPLDKKKEFNDMTALVDGIVRLTAKPVEKKTWEKAKELVASRTGVPMVIGDIPEDALLNRPAWFVQLGEFHNVRSAKQMATFFAGLNVATLLGSEIKSTKRRGKRNGYCRVLAGPFQLKSKAVGELRRIKMTTGIEGSILPKMVRQDIPQCSPQL